MNKTFRGVFLPLSFTIFSYGSPAIENLNEVSILKVIKQDNGKFSNQVDKINNKTVFINYLSGENLTDIKYKKLLKSVFTNYLGREFKNIELKKHSLDYTIKTNKFTGKTYNTVKMADFNINIELKNVNIEKKIKDNKNYYTAVSTVGISFFNSKTDKYIDEIILSSSANTSVSFNIEKDDINELVKYSIRNIFIHNKKVFENIFKDFYPANLIYTLNNKKYILFKIQVKDALNVLNLDNDVVIYKYNQFEPSKVEKIANGKVFKIGKNNNVYINAINTFADFEKNKYLIELK